VQPGWSGEPDPQRGRRCRPESRFCRTISRGGAACGRSTVSHSGSSGFEDSGGYFFTDPGGREPDRFPDDQAAWIETDEGVSVILGCSHAGVVNTLRYVRSLTGDRPLDLVLGGMHLGSASEERLDRTIEELRREAPRRLVPIHCTGSRAVARFLASFPGRCEIGRTGQVYVTAS